MYENSYRILRFNRGIKMYKPKDVTNSAEDTAISNKDAIMNGKDATMSGKDVTVSTNDATKTGPCSPRTRL